MNTFSIGDNVDTTKCSTLTIAGKKKAASTFVEAMKTDASNINGEFVCFTCRKNNGGVTIKRKLKGNVELWYDYKNKRNMIKGICSVCGNKINSMYKIDTTLDPSVISELRSKIKKIDHKHKV